MRLVTALSLVGLLYSNIALAQQQDLTLTGDLAGPYEAAGTITAHDATVRGGTSATLRAGRAVRLEAGFRVELGATFRAEVDHSLQGADKGRYSRRPVQDDLDPRLHLRAGQHEQQRR